MDGKTEFVVFCIENLAAKTGMDAEKVYELLTEKTDVLTSYILPEYDVLHTQSKEYIINDLLEVLREKGVSPCDSQRDTDAEEVCQGH